MNNFDNVEFEIINVLDQIAREAGNKQLYVGDTRWTLRIKELLGELGESLGYEVCTSGFKDRFNGEWLYDLVWYLNDNENMLIRVPLIVESEWGRTIKSIKYDFEKLLLANSEHRLMICQIRPYQRNEILNYIRIAVGKYNYLIKGDRFLIALLDDYDSGEFEYNLILK